MIAAEAEHAVPFVEQGADAVMDGIIGVDPGKLLQCDIAGIVPEAGRAEIASGLGEHIGRIRDDGMPYFAGRQPWTAQKRGIVVLRKPQ